MSGHAGPGPVPLLLSWSGGKDAAWTLHLLRQQSGYTVAGLLVTTSGDGDDARASMQGIRIEVLRAQAAACGLPLLEAGMPDGADNARYEAAFASALADAGRRWPGIRHIAFGDLLLDDIRQWREDLCRRLGWTAMFPLFGSDTAALARTMLAGGLRATLCCVDTRQLDAAFVGRAFDATLLAELPAQVDPCGERGEFHTCVHAGPMLEQPLQLLAGAAAPHDARFAITDLRLAGPAAV